MNPHAFRRNRFTTKGAEHVVVRGAHHHLYHWTRPDGGTGWSGPMDLSAVAGAQTIAGDPYGYYLQGTPHIVARGDQGQLFEWYLDGSAWRFYELSLTPNSRPIESDPMGYGLGESLGDQASQHVVALDKDGNLLEWWWTAPSGWNRVVDLHSAVGGAPPLVGRPHGYVHGFAGTEEFQHIVGRTRADGQLLEWWWSAQTGWNPVVYLSAIPDGKLIASDPFGHAFQLNNNKLVQQVMARSVSGELILWEETGRWTVTDLSGPQYGGQTIKGNAMGYILLEAQNGATRHIVARGSDDSLLEWYRLETTDWNRAENLTTDAVAPLLHSDPFGYAIDAVGAQHVLAVADPGPGIYDWSWTARAGWSVVPGLVIP
jgi:hypothetical protein